MTDGDYYVEVVPINPLYNAGNRWEVRLIMRGYKNSRYIHKTRWAETKWGAKRLARKMLRDARSPSKREGFTVR